MIWVILYIRVSFWDPQIKRGTVMKGTLKGILI